MLLRNTLILGSSQFNITSLIYSRELLKQTKVIQCYVNLSTFQNSVAVLIVIINCSTCCLVGPVKATWVCASFNSNLVIISCSTCCLADLVMTRLESKLAQTHVALTGPTRQHVLQLMMTRLES